MKRTSTLFATLLALVGAPAVGQAAKQIAPEDAPRAWVAYAEDATRTVTGWLTDETQANRARAALDRTRTALDQPTPPLIVKLWVGRDGAISRVEFAALTDQQADQDLKGLILGRVLVPPPKGMRQPMRLALQLPPAPAPPPTPSAADAVSAGPGSQRGA